ncbi:hypothetical protein [Roseateles depolymerans]|uniref:Uncharacterized protein n=1 Tax=Roseateles depolymerans TaxID=76731 RepID=A0A0U2TXF7_9BURK|nr:hypothetical protein [Roseateles depolymerans]ALV04881.1 hypothetical protein RD2015_378 [Roseateles depolymerans]REG15107.1 hypothetical protein DES44_3613 [Roseateles depolymerans]
MSNSPEYLFPLPGLVGSIYKVGADQWTAINDQAAAVVEAQSIKQLITRYIPNYPTLLPACIAWRAQTYQGLIEQAVLVGTFAASVPEVLSKIQQDVANMADDDALPSSQQFLWRVQFDSLAHHAGMVLTSVSALTPAVTTFVTENQTADVALDQIASSLPVGWQSIAGPLVDLSSGFAALDGGWNSIATQLQGLATGQANFTTAGQVRAALAAALPAWAALEQSAVAFDQHATSST